MASVVGMADAEQRSYQGLSQRIASGQDDGPFGRRRPDGQRRLLHGLVRGGRPFPLRQPPGGHARRPPDLSQMDRLGPGAAVRKLPSDVVERRPTGVALDRPNEHARYN
jgi:hypothetical protein